MSPYEKSGKKSIVIISICWVLVVLCVYAICKHRRETRDIFEHEIIPTNLSLFRSQRSGRQCDIDLPVVSIPVQHSTETMEERQSRNLNL